jgi:hypothetical protein
MSGKPLSAWRDGARTDSPLISNRHDVCLEGFAASLPDRWRTEGGEQFGGNGTDFRRFARRSTLLRAQNSTQRSDAAWRDVTVHVVASAQKNDSVARGIGLVIFQLVVRNDEPCSDIDMFPTQWLIGPGIGDDGDVFVTVDFKRISPICVRFAATRDSGIVRLHQRLIPLAYARVRAFPLSEVTRTRYAYQATERCTKDEAFHATLLSFPASSFKAMFVPRISSS